MQITRRDQKLLIVLACVLLLAGAYQFGYRKYGDKRAALQEEISTMQIRYDELISKNQDRDQYIAKTKEYQEKTSTLLASYPSEITNENEVYFTKLLEDSTGSKIVQMSYADPESFYIGTEQEVPNELVASQSTSTISIEADYGQFKKLLSYIAQNPSRKVVQNINLSYDNKSGTLTGTVAYHNYSLTGTDTTYEPYDIPAGNGQGVSNLFGDLVTK